MPNLPAILSSPPLVVPAQGPSSPTAAAGHFEHEIPFQDLQLGKLLGSGSFGDVCVYTLPPCNTLPVAFDGNCVVRCSYSAVWCGSSVAVKMLKVGSTSNKELVQDFKRCVIPVLRPHHVFPSALNPKP